MSGHHGDWQKSVQKVSTTLLHSSNATTATNRPPLGTPARANSQSPWTCTPVSCQLCLGWRSALFDPALTSAGVLALPPRLLPPAPMLVHDWSLPAILPTPHAWLGLSHSSSVLYSRGSQAWFPFAAPSSSPVLKCPEGKSSFPVLSTASGRHRLVLGLLLHSHWRSMGTAQYFRCGAQHWQAVWLRWQPRAVLAEPVTQQLCLSLTTPEA